MSYLQKLLIRGIRSFDDKSNEVIQFDKPITIISGHNGSGKTTIIECLKYSTTGYLPPNSKGGAFIHDPKLAAEMEVKAQVKLRFTSTSKQTLTVTRNLQATQKKTSGLSSKTLEATLQSIDPTTNKRNAISSKCAAIDNDLPIFIGASKAVLDNVIFCHQEDSNWPLSEPSVLKKKFDDIFEATRFTKALDNIKSLRKDRNIDLKVQSEKLKSLSSDKERANRLRHQLSSLTKDIDQKQLQYEELGIEIDTLSHANRELYESASQLTEIFQKVEILEQRESLIQENINSLTLSMTILHDSDQDLEIRQANFQSHLDEQVRLKGSETRLYQSQQESTSLINRRLQSLLTTRGQLEAEATKYDEDLRSRYELISNVARDLNLRVEMDAYDNEEGATAFLDKLKQRVKKHLQDVTNVRNEGSIKQREYEQEIQKVAGELVAKQQTKISIRQQIDEHNAKRRRIQSQIEDLNSTHANIEGMKSDVEESSRRLQQITHELNAERYDDNISDMTATIRSLEDRKDSRNSEMATLNLQADTRARLGIKKTDRDRKRNAVEASVHEKRELIDVYAKDTEPENLEISVGRVYRELEGNLEREQSAYKTLTKQLNQLETMLGAEKQRHKGKKAEIAHMDKRIDEAIKSSQTDATTLEEAIKVAEEETNGCMAEINEGSGTEDFLRKALDIAKAKHRCRCCNRAIGDGDEMVKFETYVNSRLDKLNPSHLVEVENDMKEWSRILEGLKILVPVASNLERMKSVELPSLVTAISELDAKHKNMEKDVADAEKRLDECKRAIGDVEQLKVLSSEVSRTLREVKDLDREISSLERDLKVSSNSTLTVEEVQQELRDISQRIRSTADELSGLQKAKSKKMQDLSNEQECYHEKQLSLEQTRNAARELEALKVTLSELDLEIRRLGDRSRALDPEIDALSAPKDALEEEKRGHMSEVDKAEQEARNSLQVVEGYLQQLLSANKSIKAYITGDVLNKLSETLERVTQLEEEESASRAQAERLNENIKSYEKTVASAKESERNLSDNIRYRKLLAELEDIRDQINSYDLEETTRAKKQFDEMYDESRQKESEKQAQHYALGGELLSERKRIESLTSDLDTEYKDIDYIHHRQHVAVTASTLANDDLEKYAKALEGAILQFHGLKMDEINDQIHHLWQRTYQGTDIDTIAIRSDAEGARGGKSYNYRVVMVKDRTEMDMRGRCSAGQKVLASIIIRLALADSFGDKCGILALDEPTTNLDQENIQSLASGLAELIHERKQLDVNFQLILITHDEDFLKYLSQYNVTNFFWHVGRDENQCSIIQRQTIPGA
ncbi:hypothetical protein E3P99_01838 [Wallemia hederae]|uniref:DNA repair protein RAD50 n=1 Tax=Wallemia hederae TaxID=1540922 RepID=A0A4T0FQR6_9BASI|nr:hypothetical protein E3P99_01838 [Wallemia hederae]